MPENPSAPSMQTKTNFATSNNGTDILFSMDSKMDGGGGKDDKKNDPQSELQAMLEDVKNSADLKISDVKPKDLAVIAPRCLQCDF